MAVILSVNGNLDNELRNMGHEVTSVTISKSGLYSALELLNIHNINPDYFIQRESLAYKIVFYDAYKMPCRTAFWSIDTHLNYSWQMYYGFLFDTFLTPHKSFIERLNKNWQHSNMQRLAQNGHTRSFMAHNQREHKINFVGRLQGTRPQRERIATLLLDKYHINIIDNISFGSMLELYDNTCIIPNEAIANEVNFRLLEGASCGACVISPNVGQDQDVLFEANKEILIYNNIEELQSHIDYCLANPQFCEQIGHAAWQRVQNEHSSKHRAKQLFACLQGQSSDRVCDHDLLQLTIIMLDSYNSWPIKVHENFVHKAFQNKELELFAKIFKSISAIENKNSDNEIISQFFHEVDMCLLDPATNVEHKKMLSIACGGLALEMKDVARSFFYFRIHENICNIKTSGKVQINPIQMSVNWVKALKRENKQCIIGAAFKNGCYRTAMDFVNLCKEIDPFDLSWAESLATLDQVVHSFPMQEREDIKRLLN